MYTVVSQREVRSPVAHVWQHLSEPQLVARWFADVASLGPDSSVRFDFGDGDFHDGRVVEWCAGVGFTLVWRFLGLGPDYELRVSLLPRKDGTEVSIQDRGALTLEEAQCLRVGWTEFLMRLEKTCTRGVLARFDWRRDLTVTARSGSARDAIERALADAAWYRHALGCTPLRLSRSAGRIEAALAHPSWRGSVTNLAARFVAARSDEFLLVAHEGWEGLPAEIARAERCRFTGVWIDSLRNLGAA